jgi:hypothetical protein
VAKFADSLMALSDGHLVLPNKKVISVLIILEITLIEYLSEHLPKFFLIISYFRVSQNPSMLTLLLSLACHLVEVEV